MLKLLKDIIVLPESDGRWLVMNLFSRTCLSVDSASLEVLRAAEVLSDGDLKARFANQTFSIWDVNYFSSYEGLFADPTRYIRDITKWPQAQKVDSDDLINLFKRYFLLIDDVANYYARFAPKTSLLDKEHFGNFHQQLGQELMLVHREISSKWWVNQKFTEDLKQVRNNNPYGAIQANYLSDYFQRKFTEEDVVVDIGCGTGFYTNIMARSGASVLGVDPNEEFIRFASDNAIDRARFEVLPVGQEGALDKIPDDYADYIYMSDVLLFYFVPVDPTQQADLTVLLNDIHRILKTDGTLIIVEPHYLFWLMPWLGEVNRPFTVLTEYAEKTFGVTATLSQFIQKCAKGGFAVSWMDELTPNRSFEKTNPRAFHFACHFPLWHLFELKPLSSNRKAGA